MEHIAKNLFVALRRPQGLHDALVEHAKRIAALESAQAALEVDELTSVCDELRARLDALEDTDANAEIEALGERLDTLEDEVATADADLDDKIRDAVDVFMQHATVTIE